ncbi:hypothetical protein GI374_09070 [Paracoccus sp. S-4012]|uniref:hypothetical protein n=1 Tax=Paracoccus sp. S-4012 TaxID=2665648 RepID=UPI0012AF9C3D|nr:hypothetical protein [Paracoccus sp. S-4012]MRX50593.1 hypothetical protein [Paracoccus sp. S-4012]
MAGRWSAGPGFAAALLLAGCGGAGTDATGRPRAKPETFQTVLQTDTGALPATVETRSGEILVRDLEGRVRRLPLGSARGQAAMARSEAELVAAASAAASPRATAQELMEAEFGALRRPSLPEGGEAADPSIFLGTRVAELQPGESPQIAGRPARGAIGEGARLVEVTANLKQGVDADTAFAYATCALAGWAKRTGTPYARHIRTLQQSAGGRLRVASVFTVSGQEPMGLSVVQADATLAECEARGIPAA